MKISVEKRIQVWSIIGPASLAITLYVIIVTAPTSNEALPILAIAGFLASWIGRINGLGISLIALTTIAAVNCAASGFQFPLWYLGVFATLATAWIAIALGREEIDTLLHLQNCSQKQSEEIAISKLVASENELFQANEEIAALRKQGEQYPHALRHLQYEHAKALAAVRKDLDLALQDNEELLQKQAYVAQEIEALKKEKALLEAQVKEAVITGDPSTSLGRALCRVEGMYKQLQQQYAEKSDWLDQTRKELFHAQEQLAVLQKEKEEETVFNSPPWHPYVESLIIDLHQLEHENLLLENLITQQLVK